MNSLFPLPRREQLNAQADIAFAVNMQLTFKYIHMHVIGATLFNGYFIFKP